MTGAPEPSGDFLLDAQGEDVVSGVRTPRPLHELADELPDAHAQLLRILHTLEAHYGDMQDTEFTVERGRLYMLQTRSAKRPAQAAVRFAVDAVAEGLLTREQALRTIDAGALDALLHPTFDPDARFSILARGVAASPGAAKGEVVFTAEEAVAAAAQGLDVILARPFTEADDVAGFHAARGILTSEGGKASHAALVARGMGRPAVVGAGELDIDTARPGDPGRRPDHRRGRADRDRRQHRSRHARRRPARRAGAQRALRTRAGVGRRDPAAWACAPTRTRLPTRSRLSSTARKASASAARSTCSWPPTASRRCAR